MAKAPKGPKPIKGSTKDDKLKGTKYEDTILGDAGNDSLSGDKSNDLIYAGAGNDFMIGEEGNDTLYGGDGDDLQWAYDYGDDLSYGGNGNDTLGGDLGDDTLFGDDGNDVLEGHDGTDVIFGGTGNDYIAGFDINDITSAKNRTMDPSIGSDDGADDFIDGGDGNDTMFAGKGDDTVLGGTGEDYLFGGDGDDLMNAGSGNDTVSGGEGDNTIYGDLGNDAITAGAGDDLIDGGQGNDNIQAGDGNNTILGDDGNDVISSGSGNDQISGGNGDDTVTAGDGRDAIDGGAGADRLFGGAGKDTLTGGEGDDLLSGDAGDDLLDGGNGADTLIVGGRDVGNGGAGDDLVLLAPDEVSNMFNMIMDGGSNGAGGDVLNTSASSESLTVVLSSNANSGTINGLDNDAGTDISFTDFEKLITGSGQDSVSGGGVDGNIKVDTGAGSDTVTQQYNTGYNGVAFYDGGAGTDTFALNFTAAQWANPAAQAEVSAYVAHLAAGNAGIPFTFTSIDTTVVNFEVFNITVDGGEVDPSKLVANPDSIGYVEDSGVPSIAIDLLANDEIGNRADSVELLSGSNYGTLTLNPSLSGPVQTATLVFTPNDALMQSLSEDEVVTETVTYRITDKSGRTAESSVVISIVGTNDAPTLSASVLSAVEDGPSVTLDLSALGNDIDGDDNGASLTYTIADAPSTGTASISGTTLTYNAGADANHLAAGETMVTTIAVTATDQHGESATNNVEVTITGTNDAPTIGIAEAADVVMEQDGSYTVTGAFTFDDVDLTDTHSVTAVDDNGLTVNASIVMGTTGGNTGQVEWFFTSALNGGAPGDLKTVTFTVTDSSGASFETSSLFVLTTFNRLADLSDPIEAYSYIGDGPMGFTISDFYGDPDGDTLIAMANPDDVIPGAEFFGSSYFELNADTPAYQYLTLGQIETFTYTYLVDDGTESQVATVEWMIEGSRDGVYGTAGDDNLVGASIYGELLDGGAGDDTLTGGEGEDIFAYMSVNDGFDLITDFTQGEDFIGISASAFGGNLVAGDMANVQIDASFDIANYNSGTTDGVLILSTDGTDGTLYWDANGGLADDAVAIAQLTGVVDLQPEDVFVFI